MIKKLVKRFILSSFILYGYNLIAMNFNMVLPLNIITISIVYLLGIPGFFALLLFKILI